MPRYLLSVRHDEPHAALDRAARATRAAEARDAPVEVRATEDG